MTLVESLLWPVSLVYGAGARMRAHAYQAGVFQSRRLESVVVSVGNLTTGGTGKTPMVLWVAQRCLDSGRKVGILSRGYRPLPQQLTADGKSSKQAWNDEVALLHERLEGRVEFGIGAERFTNGKDLEERGVNCFILDDGFQHLQLSRDLDIVMIDAIKPFGGGHILPAGRLREPVSALTRADIVVIHRGAERVPAIEAVVQRFSKAPIYLSRTKLLNLQIYGGGEITIPEAKQRKFFAFCGIGNPVAFFDDLKTWGLFVAGRKVFHDHYHYSAKDIVNLEGAANAAGADALICTEKDSYDLPADVATRLPIVVCRIGMQFNDEEGLWQNILKVIDSKKPGRME